MKTLIVYHSEHHGNTKKLLDAIAKEGNVTLLDASSGAGMDCGEYDLIGFASGIYYQKFHKNVVNWVEKNLSPGKKVFFLYTCGVKRDSYADDIALAVGRKGAQLVGSYVCPGYDTFGPFKLVGGIAKGRPNEEDIAGAVRFYREIER